ncbi:MAG: hypothetical protein JW768_00090, partial [Chitinispirillaceae bacterium]|nr:hypothetical protein [Chitinispirillaceae bacterium]
MKRIAAPDAIRYYCITLCVMLAVVFHFSGTTLGTAGFLLSLAAALVILFIRSLRLPRPWKPSSPVRGGPPPHWHKLAQREAQAAIAGVQVSVLGAPFRKEQWERAENVVDMILDTCLQLLSASLQAHTAAVFFPAADGEGYCLRRFV